MKSGNMMSGNMSIEEFLRGEVPILLPYGLRLAAKQYNRTTILQALGRT